MPFAGARAHLVPALHEGHTVKATWQLPPVQGLYRKKAEDYWSHLLGHEGPGSLLSALKARKWATGLYAGTPRPTTPAVPVNPPQPWPGAWTLGVSAHRRQARLRVGG